VGLFHFQEETMTIDNLFGPEGKKPRTLRLKVIKPIYESLVYSGNHWDTSF
jgi:hypothetical protein